MRRLEIALGLIEQRDEYILQLRDSEASIGAAGLIGCFGGKIKDGEKPEAAVAREIAEETSLETQPDDWKLLGEVKVVSDHQLEPVSVLATAFRYTVRSSVEVRAKEGQIARLNKQNIENQKARLTPATKALFEELL
jgi:8-oxo-dGTP pyrophosphatase MutT (NUDIX family)